MSTPRQYQLIEGVPYPGRSFTIEFFVDPTPEVFEIAKEEIRARLALGYPGKKITNTEGSGMRRVVYFD